MYDVIVVGARCAGAPTAMLFARRGYRVLLLERSRFPRDTLSTLYIHQPGVALLRQWGLLDNVTATGCPPITSALHQVGDVRLEGCSAPVNGIRAAYAPRRFLLDTILAEAAVASGAELREECGVTGLVFDGDRVIGVRCGKGPVSSVEHARLVVGADGMRSTVAAVLGAPMIMEHPLMTCIYYTFWAGVTARFEAYGARGRWAGCAPTNDGLTLVGAYFPQREFPAVRAAAMDAYLHNVRSVAPDLYARMQAGTQAERLFGTGAQRNFFRLAAGPGWALVGDAGHHKDSITADGITDAFRQARLLIDCIGPGLRDESHLQAALRRFSRERDGMLTDRYRTTLSIARLRPDRRLDTLSAIAADEALVERFFTRMAGADPDSAAAPVLAHGRP